MKSRRGVPCPLWTPDELRVLDRYVRNYHAGRDRTARDASAACAKELRRVRQRRPGNPGRTPSAVYTRLQVAVRERRRGGRDTHWSEEELAVLDRHASALKAGRFEDAVAAAFACHREIKRLWRRHPASVRAPTPRTEQAVRAKVYTRAAASGWRSIRMAWSDGEQAILERHVAALLKGRYKGAWEAARACRKELERRFGRRLRAGRSVHRTLGAVYYRLAQLANRRGWTRPGTRMLPQERRVIERHARRLLGTGAPGPKSVARECCAELARLHEQLRVKDPDAFARVTPRTPSTIATYVHRRAIGLGRPTLEDWQDDELRIVDRHARALVARKYRDADMATLACRKDLARLRRSWRKTDPERYRGTRPRPYNGVYDRLRKWAHALGQRWPRTRWTPEELVLLNRAVDWYDRNRGIRQLRPYETAVDGLLLELEQIGSRRTLYGCQARFWKEWQRRHGS